MAAKMRAVEESEAIPLDDLSERWERFESADPGDVVDAVVRDYGERAEQRRDVLVSWLAFQLGYSRYFNRREGLESRPLWELLDRTVYERLGFQAERALLSIARSTGHPLRSAPPPKAATAAIALWRNGRTPAVRSEARRLLREHPLPNERRWLYRLVGRFLAIGAIRTRDGTGLFDLAAVQLGSKYWQIAAELGALYLLHRMRPLAARPEDEERLVAACDRAAQLHWRREGDWLELMAEAAVGGRLRAPWLERAVEVAMRRVVGDRETYERFRSYHDRRVYRAGYGRLDELYDHLLSEMLSPEAEQRIWARRRLFEELARTASEHPKRALRLAEVIAVHEHPLRFGTFRHRLRHALRQIEAKEPLDALGRFLAGLYVATYDIEPYAFKFVHSVSERIAWNEHPVADRSKLERYLKVSDYESAFEDLTFEIRGTTLELEDKDASLRVLYFLEKRFEPTSVIRLVRRTLAPVEWMGSTLGTIDPLEDASERGIELFRAWIEDRDRREEVVSAYSDAGVPVSDFGAIRELGADFIEDYVAQLRNRRLLFGAGAGLVGGVASSLRLPGGALVDIPVKLAIALEVGAKFSWYYGFDPRRHPRLPLQILAVALYGPRPTQTQPDELHRSLAEFAIQTSFLVESVGTRGVGRIASRTLRGLVEQFSDGGAGDALAAVVERAARSQLDARAERRTPLPGLGAVAGGLMNAALVYDVCESAQVVLTDRFLARKYPGWEPKLGVDGGAGSLQGPK